jgi:tetratricopeptide (TPR) repeat protein
MKPTEQDITLVEKYFDADLSSDELSHFNARMEHDEDFKALFQREKIIIGAIRNQGLIDNLLYLKSIDEKIQGNQSYPIASGIKGWYYYAAAAVVALLIAVAFLLPGKENTDELFAAYFTPYPNVVQPLLRGDDATAGQAKAFQDYEQKNYEAAAAGFKELLDIKEEPGILLLLGNSNLMLGKSEEAEENFITLIKNYDEFDLQAKWFLSLSYLKSGDTENARKILKELGETEVSYASRAKELLEKVD